MADANKVIEKLVAQISVLTRDNAILSAEVDELRDRQGDCTDGEER